MNWIQKLGERWKVKNAFHVIMILIIFACTGFTVLFIKRPLFDYYFPSGDVPTWLTVAYWIFIFPVYNMFLLFYGFVFGQFRFFWDFEKRFFSRIFSIFRKK
jgi:hypothetical protein